MIKNFMILQFKKEQAKPATLTIRRSDGSTTWTKIQEGLEAHDLAHYAVETVLGFQKAFYGLIDQGFEVGDFELPREERPAELIPANLPVEALQTEHIVNLLQVEFWNYGEDEGFMETLAEILGSNDLPFPETLTQEKLTRIREVYRSLVFRWQMLQPGGMLELSIAG